RALLGEVEAVTATGDPPGDRPSENLVVQLRGPEGRRAEVRLWTGPVEPSRLVVAGAEGSLMLEYDPTFATAARLIRRTSGGGETVVPLDDWDPHAAILKTLAEAIAGRESHPDLIDGTRATELAEATVRSLRRGRTVDLHHEEISEEGTFKSVMTSFGCVILLCILVALPAALVGPALGLPWTIYIAYVIPPVLIGFIFLQLLRYVIRRRGQATQVREWRKEI
ncbi:MAG: hypothetical protein JO034_20180, partial [Singulisphaera sp.]|nr:hypothetical protein [Singulisphaera sp.]